MDIGNQYKFDDKFKAAARLHQSKYRAEVLQVDFENYGNRLKDHDAKALLNYYDKLNSREVLRERYPSYSRRRDADMLRSEHIPFNLLAPLATSRTLAIDIIRNAFGIDCTQVGFIGMEYTPAPREQYLNDGTAFDAYMEVTKQNGRKYGIGIEVKYTEKAYKVGKTEKVNIDNHQSQYWKTARVSGCFNNPDDDILGTDLFRQIWRNHLLGLSMVENGDIDEFYSITLFPNGNKHFHEAIPKYISLLGESGKNYVFGCTFERYIDSIGGSAEFMKWKDWLHRRYVVK